MLAPSVRASDAPSLTTGGRSGVPGAVRIDDRDGCTEAEQVERRPHPEGASPDHHHVGRLSRPHPLGGRALGLSGFAGSCALRPKTEAGCPQRGRLEKISSVDSHRCFPFCWRPIQVPWQ